MVAVRGKTDEAAIPGGEDKMAHAPKLLARPLLPPPVPDVVKHPHVPRITLVSTLIARNSAHILQLPPLPSAALRCLLHAFISFSLIPVD